MFLQEHFGLSVFGFGLLARFSVPAGTFIVSCLGVEIEAVFLWEHFDEGVAFRAHGVFL